MANTISALIGENWEPMVQDFLTNKPVARDISTVMSPDRKDGDTIHWPVNSPQRTQTYTIGSDLSIDNVEATDSTMKLDTIASSTFPVDKMQQSVVTTEWVTKQAQDAAYSIGNQIDQDLLKTSVDGADSGNSVSGGTLNSSSILEALTESRARLSEANGFTGNTFAVVDPARLALLTQSQVGNTFTGADRAFQNGFAGDVSGFRVYESNNLPAEVDLTVDTQPTAGDTFTIKGVTFTFVADGTASSAGEVNVGANLADAQSIIVDVINGDNAGTDYVDVSLRERNRLRNQQVAATAFSSDVTTITAFGRINGSETFTAATNVFGTETTQILTGSMGAPSLGMSREVFLEVTKEPRRHQENYLTSTRYGHTVFTNDAYRLSVISCNA